ncbi:MAG: prohibitin family protein [Rhodobiaceae bacterium]|nr:prohibitin family protein [Rhodobiaceae bacterium]MCC0056046.1 prohibitin family protein [Rhodobiaceae bacterium]
MRAIRAIVFVIIGLFVLAIFSGAWYTVDQGERAVILRNGAIIRVAEPGLGFKVPFIDEAKHISVQTRAKVYDQVPSYSRDQQPADLRVSVNYRLLPDKVAEIYAEYGGEDGIVSRLLDRQVPTQVKNVFGQYNAITAVQERARFNTDVSAALQTAVDGPIIVLGVQIENIDYSAAYETSVEQRMLAEVEVQKLRQNAEREKVQAEITVTQAKARAEAVRAQAQAEADAIRLKGQAEADAIKARGDALRQNPDLVSLTATEKWNGTLPTTMVPNGVMPFIGVR